MAIDAAVGGVPAVLDPVGEAVASMLALVWTRPDWHRQAACRGQPPEWWFPEPTQHDAGRRAQAICEGCPVRRECADYALDRGEDHGRWGGLSVRERVLIRRERRGACSAAATVPVHAGPATSR